LQNNSKNSKNDKNCNNKKLPKFQKKMPTMPKMTKRQKLQKKVPELQKKYQKLQKKNIAKITKKIAKHFKISRNFQKKHKNPNCLAKFPHVDFSMSKETFFEIKLIFSSSISSSSFIFKNFCSKLFFVKNKRFFLVLFRNVGLNYLT